MLTGNMRHKDSAGHEGLITDGGVQWMTAGRGVIHSEMPEQNDGVMEGSSLAELAGQGQDAPALVPRHPEPRGAPNSPRPTACGSASSPATAMAGQAPCSARTPFAVPGRDFPKLAAASVAPPAARNACPHRAAWTAMVNGRSAWWHAGAWPSWPTKATVSRCRPAPPPGAAHRRAARCAVPIAQYGPFVMNIATSSSRAVKGSDGRLA